MNCGDLKVILGCGETKRDGWIGLDKGDYGQEIIRDLRKGLPFCENSCSELFADQVLEHIQLNEDFIFVMNECLRVLKPGGQFEILVPFWGSEVAFKDPTHCRYFTKQTFTYLEPLNRWQYGFDKRWKILVNEKIDDSQLHVILKANKNV
jgi:predicted SAM-dependent methyltransferase